MCCIPAAGIVKCSQLTSSFQVRQHGLSFPVPIMVKIKPTGPLSSSWTGQDTNQGQYSSFVPHLSVPPLLQYRYTVHSLLCGTQNTWHPRGNIVKEDPKSFLMSSYLGPAPLATTADTATMAPPSFSLTHRAGTCLPLLACKGNRGGANHMTAKQMWFSSLLLFLHTWNLSHSVFLIFY